MPALKNGETQFVPGLPSSVYGCLLKKFQAEYGDYGEERFPGLGFSRNSATGSGAYETYFVGIGLPFVDQAEVSQTPDGTECTFCFAGNKHKYLIR